MGVLTYLLSLPNEARVTIRTLAEQRKEGRARIAGALHELEESRYLRRVVRKDRETGQLFAVYEVFDTPYEDVPPAGETEEGQNLASGESAVASSGAPPSGEKTREQEPPSPPPAEPAEPADVGERTALAARLLGSLGRTDARLTLGAAEALRLAPLVEAWWDAGASSAQVRAALTDGLPRPLYSARALVENRLRRKCPAGTPAEPVTTVQVEPRKPGASGYREAARRGGVVARALLRGQPTPA
ncbi:hypothetical protein [Streptomyces griseus]|uniref:hypothetical protein n=1 Tax=Streptomyces griseus TaxID=1911 RepID=UPI000566377A|nr:hypothetical protein [Streptomyces griseus]